MNSNSWRITTPVLDSRGRSSSERDDIEVNVTVFQATGWKHVVADHFDHPGWTDVLAKTSDRGVLLVAARQDETTPEASRAVNDLLSALRAALTRTIERPHFVETEEVGYPVLLSDLGTPRSVYSREPVESRRGLIAVDDSGLIVIVRDQRLATAYFPECTAHLRGSARFREAALLARRKANLGAYHDPKYDRYWQRTKTPCFHDIETWARSASKRREAGHGAR